MHITHFKFEFKFNVNVSENENDICHFAEVREEESQKKKKKRAKFSYKNACARNVNWEVVNISPAVAWINEQIKYV